ncbi:MAG TPA: DUF2085 domain-containing protein [bacterium]|nr:DUF2085 domain-containing protein [bacterium]
MEPNSLIYRITSYVCHQQPERCFIIWGKLLPLCARCTGIYIGFLTSFLFLWIMSARKKFLHFSKKTSLFSAIFFFVFAAESFLSLRGMADTGNNMRFLFGLLGGCSLGIFSFGLINYSLRENTFFAKTYFSSRNLLILMLVIIMLFFMKLIFNFSFFFYVWLSLSFMGLIFTYAAVNMTLVVVFWHGKLEGENFKLKLALYTAILMAAEFLMLFIFKRKPF